MACTLHSIQRDAGNVPLLLQSTIACALEQHLLHLKKFCYRLDGDNIRFGLNKDLGFDEKSRNENIRRIGEVRAPSRPALPAACPWVPLRFCRSSSGLPASCAERR